jgi:DNA polymerase
LIVAFTKNILSFYHENGCMAAVGDVPVDRYDACLSKPSTPQSVNSPTGAASTEAFLDAQANQSARPVNPQGNVPVDRYDACLATPATPQSVNSSTEAFLDAQANQSAKSANPQGNALSASLSGCQTLQELKQALMRFEGCILQKTAQHTVFADGNPQSGVMLVGEAPGAEEDAQGIPFVGQSGQLLDAIMASIGLDRTRMYISNIIPWRPPGNRPPTTQEIALCLPFIQKHIALVKPKVLLLIGGVAAKALLHTSEGIMKLRGQWLDYTTVDGDEMKAMATFHPAYLLRSPNQKMLVWRDMLMVKAYLESQKVLP